MAEITAGMVKRVLKDYFSKMSNGTNSSLGLFQSSEVSYVAVNKHIIKYCEKVCERSGKNLYWSIKNLGEVLNKLKAKDFNETSLSTYDFLPHNLIKDKFSGLIEKPSVDEEIIHG